MSTEGLLAKIHAKSEHVRRRYAFWSAFGVTAIIVAFWLGSFSAFKDSSRAVVASTVNSVGTPGQSLIASVGSFFGDIKDILFGPKKVTYSSVEVGPGNK